MMTNPGARQAFSRMGIGIFPTASAHGGCGAALVCRLDGFANSRYGFSRKTLPVFCLHPAVELLVLWAN
jgi:hypothetical protein